MVLMSRREDPCVQPVQDMAAERIADREVGVVKVLARISLHFQSLHYCARPLIFLGREGDELTGPLFLKGADGNGARCLGCQALAPVQRSLSEGQPSSRRRPATP